MAAVMQEAEAVRMGRSSVRAKTRAYSFIVVDTVVVTHLTHIDRQYCIFFIVNKSRENSEANKELILMSSCSLTRLLLM